MPISSSLTLPTPGTTEDATLPKVPTLRSLSLEKLQVLTESRHGTEDASKTTWNAENGEA